jgi:hypothetical protein
LAAFAGHLSCVELLISRGAYVRAASISHTFTFLPPSLSFFVYFPLDRSDVDGFTPLHCAAQGGHLEICAELLARGADVNARNDEGATPLLLAVQGGFTDTVRLLLSRGADPNQTSDIGFHPLHLAILGERSEKPEVQCITPSRAGCHVAIVTALLEAKSDIHYLTNEGTLPASILPHNEH